MADVSLNVAVPDECNCCVCGVEVNDPISVLAVAAPDDDCDWLGDPVNYKCFTTLETSSLGAVLLCGGVPVPPEEVTWLVEPLVVPSFNGSFIDIGTCSPGGSHTFGITDDTDPDTTFFVSDACLRAISSGASPSECVYQVTATWNGDDYLADFVIYYSYDTPP